ncbi:hypothetical protein [Niabella sp.]|uniref:hypothetical protein n=1 Tax=Niabella sp. TaxID=1962976 RepID=UPI00260A1EA2|nr:hypothetical protein [Niabella sp.]
MLSDSKIIALYCIVDDILKSLQHSEDLRVRVSDAEIITTAFVSALYFGGHQDNARHFMKLKGYVPDMLDKSRYCRRLHRLSELLLFMFAAMGKQLKDMAGAADYRLDSFPLQYAIISALTGQKYYRARYSGVNMPPCAGIFMVCVFR